MKNYKVYQDIQARTGGEIYIGVAGPVRTGKSTFIKRFMEQLVLPSLGDENSRRIATDEMPQSSNGRTIMTTEPKFVPREAAVISLAPDVTVKVRLVDCVGYLVPGAAGQMEEGKERMVHTPWFEEEIPFSKAAEIGTRKVIHDHSTLGILVTTDGSFGELNREAYRPAEEQAVAECKKIGKPFLLLMNSRHPQAEETRFLTEELSKKYHVTVLPVNCETMDRDEILSILEQILLEFPVLSLHFHLPRWVDILAPEHPLKKSILDQLREHLPSIACMRDVPESEILEMPALDEIQRTRLDLSTGSVDYQIKLTDESFFQTLTEYSQLPISCYAELLRTLRSLAEKQDEYNKVRDAISQVRQKGYGVVIPDRRQIRIQDPEMVKKGSRYGVRMTADAPSIHMIEAVIRTEISPIVGSEEQANDLLKYITSSKEGNEDGFWETSIFGKSIGQIVEEGIQSKTECLSEDTQTKLQGALQKIVNSGSGNLICIIL
ncbi:MAG: stage IV sporulation protein A [Clostridiales bacterium]|nr:stage IV sporulation protein A [Clostridiales bacterium]